ncbi:MAG: hypothetical protein ACQEQC_07925 [Elusimicrobiota bacterium]
MKGYAKNIPAELEKIGKKIYKIKVGFLKRSRKKNERGIIYV